MNVHEEFINTLTVPNRNPSVEAARVAYNTPGLSSIARRFIALYALLQVIPQAEAETLFGKENILALGKLLPVSALQAFPGEEEATEGISLARKYLC